MSVYVDELMVHHNAWGPFKTGSCHMTADTEDELHKMALRIGMKTSWFQNNERRPNMWHYDLTPSRRARAVRLGAIEVTTRELCTMMYHRKPNEPLQRGKEE